jgi:hypothetical protein
MNAINMADVQEAVLSGVRKGQEAVVGTVQTCAEAARAVTPKMPVPSVPFADRLPSPEDVVARVYDLAEAMLASQRKFAEDLLKATTPLLPGRSGTSQEDTAA